MAERNPFTPAFGTVPPIMAGRDRLLAELHAALEQGVGDPNLSSILVGARDTGKTACLTRLCEDASDVGWVSASSSAIPGLLDDILQQAQRASAQLVRPKPQRQLTGLSVGPLGASWDMGDEERGNWRTRMSALLEGLNARDVGLLITVDEVDASLSELITMAVVYQHFVRERRKVALLMAGLPSHVHALLNDKSVSFLRRAQRHPLGTIADADVRDALKRTVASGGKTIDEEALGICVEATGGFPYMLQLVGYRSWQSALGKAEVGKDDARAGIRAAQEDFREHVLAPAYRELSAVDLRFAKAMLPDKAESRLADIARRMGVTSRYASKYRGRLVAAGIVEELSRGVLRFAIPGFRKYLQEMG